MGKARSQSADNLNIIVAKKRTSKKSAPQFTPEQRLTTARAIFDEYAKGIHTLKSCCQMHTIAERTLYTWVSGDAIIASLKKTAEDLIKAPKPEELRVKARVSLEKLITGCVITETHTEAERDAAGNISRQKVRKVEKNILPDTTAVIFALKNTDPAFKEGLSDTNVIVGDVQIEHLHTITPEILKAAEAARKERFSQLQNEKR